MLNDVGRKTMAAICNNFHTEMLTHSRHKSQLVNVTMPFGPLWTPSAFAQRPSHLAQEGREHVFQHTLRPDVDADLNDDTGD